MTLVICQSIRFLTLTIYLSGTDRLFCSQITSNVSKIKQRNRINIKYKSVEFSMHILTTTVPKKRFQLTNTI